jgi:transcriptional regulator with XRE-family HTH domain
MPESFGARLRERRERQHVALATIAEQTKIKVSLLEALERDDVSHWPTGIFRRAFIRAYAHAIGLEPDVIVREFLELYPDPIEVVETVSAVAAAVDGASTSSGAPTRLRHLVGSAIGSLSRLRIGGVPKSPLPVEDPVQASVEDSGLSAIEDHSAAGSVLVNVPAAPGTSVPAASEMNVSAASGMNVPMASEPDLSEVAHLCTELSRLDDTRVAGGLLQRAVSVLDAIGLIVWVWHPETSELRPALAQGYSDKVLAQLPKVERNTDNATAAAFRSANTCVVKGSDQASGALAVPLMAPAGCVGVLAIELPRGSEQRESMRAFVTILAAQLARVVAAVRPAGTAEPMPGWTASELSDVAQTASIPT